MIIRGEPIDPDDEVEFGLDGFESDLEDSISESDYGDYGDYEL